MPRRGDESNELLYVLMNESCYEVEGVFIPSIIEKQMRQHRCSSWTPLYLELPTAHWLRHAVLFFPLPLLLTRRNFELWQFVLGNYDVNDPDDRFVRTNKKNLEILTARHVFLAKSHQLISV
jgi:hypothetical protein